MTGEFEPNDSRNVTGTASTDDGRWTNQAGQPLDAAGQPRAQAGGMGQSAESGWSDDDRGMAERGQGSAFAFGGQIREHMSVVDAEGTMIGRVDEVEEDRIKLTRSDSDDGEHHYIGLDEVEAVEGDEVRLSGSGRSDFAMNGE